MEVGKAGAVARARLTFVEQWEETIMPTFIITMNWTEQGIHSVKDAPKRAGAARDSGTGSELGKTRIQEVVP